MTKLEELKDNHNWHTVLIDWAYYTIQIFEGSGLNEERDLGPDCDEWYSEGEDLFTYYEEIGNELFELITSTDLRLV